MTLKNSAGKSYSLGIQIPERFQVPKKSFSYKWKLSQ